MNFQTLKGLIDNLSRNFRCPMCQSQVGEANMDIIGAAGNTINVEIECEKCKKHTMIKAEIAHIDVSNMQVGMNELAQIKNRFQKIRQELGKIQSPQSSEEEIASIKDADIVDLSKNLKKEHISVQDIFGNNDSKS